MTQDEIIEMAQQCGLIGIRPHLDGIYTEALEAFAELVAAKEREECAQIAQQKISKTWSAPNSPKEWWELACENIATAIRARGQA
jgi:hypothetical protein